MMRRLHGMAGVVVRTQATGWSVLVRIEAAQPLAEDAHSLRLEP